MVDLIAALTAKSNESRGAIGAASESDPRIVNGLQPETGVYRVASVAALWNAAVPGNVERLLVEAYDPNYAVPETVVGASHYRRVASEPSHDMWVQSDDGAYWELDEVLVTIEMCGASTYLADNTAEIQRAVDYVLSRPLGGEIYIPARNGAFTVQSQINVPLMAEKCLKFCGAGASSRIIAAWTFTDSSIFYVGAAIDPFGDRYEFADMTIMGRSGATYIGVEAEQANGIAFRNVKFSTLAHAVKATSCYAPKFIGCYYYAIAGAIFWSTTASHHAVFAFCDVNTQGAGNEAAIRVDAATDNLVVSYCDFEGGYTVLKMAGGTALTFEGCYVEYQTASIFNFTATMRGGKIARNWLALSAVTDIQNVDGIAIEDNNVYNMTLTWDGATARRVRSAGNVQTGSGVVSGNYGAIGLSDSGTETTQYYSGRMIAIINKASSIVANQNIGSLSFLNRTYVPIAGITAHYKNNNDGASCYMLFSADAVVDAIKVEGQKSTFKGNISLFPGSSVTPTANGEVTFQFTSNTSLAIRARGSDGTVRSATLTLS